MSGLYEKKKHLVDILRSMKKFILAFSGGVDSSLLLKIASEEESCTVVPVMFSSQIISAHDKKFAEFISRKIGFQLQYVNIDHLNDEQFVNNTPQRCYYCKQMVFKAMLEIAKKEGIEHVIDGTNADDLRENRPGLRALRELGIRSPLAEAGLTKSDILDLAKELDLNMAIRPSNTCLATRIPFYNQITEKKLKMVEAAESFLHEMGIGLSRVRHHGTIARIEVLPHDMEKLLEERERVVNRFLDIGFVYVTLDLGGYVSGSLEKVLKV